MSKYDDIINLKRPTSLRPKAPLSTRAAQFAPFSALAGYSEAIDEIRRITTPRKNLTEGSKEEINEKLRIIKNNLKRLPEVEITYFVADNKKAGGEYKKIISNIKKIDEINRKIILVNGENILIDDIDNISGSIFNLYEVQTINGS